MTIQQILNALSILPEHGGLHTFDTLEERSKASEIYPELQKRGLVKINETEEDGVIAAGLTQAGKKFLMANKS